MGNWLKKIKTRPRKKGKYEHTQSAIINKEMFTQAQSTLQKKDRHYYRRHIVPCGECGRKFRMNRELVASLDYHNRKKICPICRKEFDKMYLMVSEKEQRAIERLHEAQGCTVRKMTPEEMEKFA